MKFPFGIPELVKIHPLEVYGSMASRTTEVLFQDLEAYGVTMDMYTFIETAAWKKAVECFGYSSRSFNCLLFECVS